MQGSDYYKCQEGMGRVLLKQIYAKTPYSLDELC